MKAKTLLIAAAALAAGVMTSQAQVYSQNIVGYINVPLSTTSGYVLVANQLDLDGTGTNNTVISAVGTNLPANSQILAWTGSSFKTTTFNGTAWNSAAVSAPVVKAMQPGSGFFIYTPTPTNVTFVGNVITGSNSYPITAGYQIVAPSGPVSGTLDTTNHYVANVNDAILVWNGSSFKTHTYNGSAWNGGGDPQLSVGQSVFLNAASSSTWNEVLNVQ
jgi:hypothetical protein